MKTSRLKNKHVYEKTKYHKKRKKGNRIFPDQIIMTKKTASFCDGKNETHFFFGSIFLYTFSPSLKRVDRRGLTQGLMHLIYDCMKLY